MYQYFELSLWICLRWLFSLYSRPLPCSNCWLLDIQYLHHSQNKGWNPLLSGSRHWVVNTDDILDSLLIMQEAILTEQKRLLS